MLLLGVMVALIVVVQTVRSDAEGMLQVMGSMEKQISAYAAKEEATAQLARESKQKVE